LGLFVIMHFTLIALKGPARNQEVALNGHPVLIGRNWDADIHIPDNWVSSRHCEIHQLGRTLVVRDVGSRNGTFVNGFRISETHLFPGDTLTIGTTFFQVDYRRRASKPPAVGAMATDHDIARAD
jgi:pSer/pThr/pTyr-binding forkhead associated (FHA) protein